MKRYKVIVKQTSKLTDAHTAPCVVCGKDTYWKGDNALCVYCAADPEKMAEIITQLRAALAQAQAERDACRDAMIAANDAADLLKSDLAQAQAERDAATRRAEQAEAVAARWRSALVSADPWTNSIPFNCVYCDAVYDGAVDCAPLERHNDGCVWAEAALAGPEGGPR